jgi:carbon storage regulator
LPQGAYETERSPSAEADPTYFGGTSMLVLSRERGESIMVDGPDGSCLCTVLEVRGEEVTLLINHTPPNAPGALDSWTAKLVRESAVKVGSAAEITVVDIRAEKVRLGFLASKSASVHRLEVWEAIKRENRRAAGDDAEDGLAGSRAPRPQGPKPPSLEVRLVDPPTDGADE